MRRESLTDADAAVDAARTGMVARMAALEGRVVGTIDEVNDSVRDTVADARSAVGETGDRMRGLLEQGAVFLQDSIDLRSKIREYPWHGAGFATAAGIIVGFVSRSRAGIPRIPALMREEPASGAPSMMQTIRRELAAVGERFITAASQALQQNIEAALPTAAPVEDRPRERPVRHHQHANGRHAVY